MSTTGAQGAAAKKPRWYQQLLQIYRLTYRHDKRTPLFMALAFVVVTGVALTVALLLGGGGVLATVVGALLSVTLGVLVAFIVLARLADRAVYTQMDGVPGAVSFALEQIKRGWWYEKEPVAVDPRTKDMVFRAVGRPGIVLISEGPLPRVLRLTDNERKRHSRVLSGVPVHVLHVGNGDEQVPLRGVVARMRRLPRALTPAEVSAVGKRVSALKATRPPVPKGIDPNRMRPDRRAVRGR